MAIYALGVMLGPIIGMTRKFSNLILLYMLTSKGPVIGGFVAESIGWRWIFRIQTIAASLPLQILSYFARANSHRLSAQR